MSDEDKTIADINFEAYALGWTKQIGPAYDATGRMVAPSNGLRNIGLNIWLECVVYLMMNKVT
eukprot:10441482-Heterocapsa_arctica.AAC.1